MSTLQTDLTVWQVLEKVLQK
jgi:hypothetical protein